MNVAVKAKSDFVHGKFSLTKGEEASMPEATAKDLRNAGLVMYVEEGPEHKLPPRAKVAPRVSNKMAVTTKNKVEAGVAGERVHDPVQPESAFVADSSLAPKEPVESAADEQSAGNADAPNDGASSQGHGDPQV